jgi:hypothetical protein
LVSSRHSTATPRHHTLITGTGRAGTTVLMQILTELGYDTGFRNAREEIDPIARAGMERRLEDAAAPYFVKDPKLCDRLAVVMRSNAIVIDHAIVPVRDLFSAAESRRRVTRRQATWWQRVPQVRGGLFGTRSMKRQEQALALKLYTLIHTLAEHDVPTTFLSFPRFVHDPAYLYHKLEFVWSAVGYGAYLAAFQSVVDPALVHDFTRDPPD